MTPPYLSPEWFTAADALLRADEGLRERCRGRRVVLQQTVSDAEGSDGALTWCITFDDGEVSLTVGAVDAPDVAFTCDRATAVAVRDGAESAQTAFIQGRLRIESAATTLLDNAELFADLNDALAPLR